MMDLPPQKVVMQVTKLGKQLLDIQQEYRYSIDEVKTGLEFSLRYF